MFQWLDRIDGSAVIWVCVRRRRSLDLAMKLASRIGDGYVWTAVGILVGILLPGGFRIFQQLVLAFGLELSVYKLVKSRFSRPRPFTEIPQVTMLVSPPDEFSFPSGHMAAAFVMVTVLTMHAVPLGILLVPIALVIGISRVYLGVHYPTDVVAGGILGIVSGYSASVLR